MLEAAADWVRGHGRDRLLGPADFTTNDEVGLLVEGYERAPMVLQPWHPPYYRELLEEQGLGKAMDLLMWELWLGDLKQGDAFHDFIEEAAEKCVTEHGVIVRHMRKNDLEAEIGRFLEVYNEAWGKNWGFVPVTDAEVEFQAQNLKPVLSEDWTMIAERDGEVLGAALTLPDVNQVLEKMNGSLLPFGWLRFLRGMRNPQGVAGVPGSDVTRSASSRSASSPPTSTSASPRCSTSATARPPPDAAEGRRDGLDPRDQRADEPRHGGDGRRGREALPDLRALAFRLNRRPRRRESVQCLR